MNIYKMKMIAVVASLFMMATPLVAGRCTSCAEKMAIKQSIKEALAAAAAASKPSKHVDSLEDAQKAPCCADCADGGTCQGKRCACSNDDGKQNRAERDWVSVKDADHLGCCAQGNNTVGCILKCCKKVKDILNAQGEDAKRCCKHIRHELDEVEELIISQIDQTANCCSVTEALLVSQIDQTANCCSVTEALLLSQIDQTAVCCSVTESLIGDPCASSVVDILNLLDLPATVIDTIDTTCLDTLTLLKSIYALLVQVLFCNPCNT